MRSLLDTHVAIWGTLNDPRLSKSVADLIADPANEIIVSAVSLWEIAVKYPLAARRTDTIPFSAAEAADLFLEAGYALLGVSPDHAVAVERLPVIHGDPFDRLLVAQALTEPLRLITHDSTVARYSDAFVYF